MFEDLGPFITIRIILGNAAAAIIAAWFWSLGHVNWLVLRRKALPLWLIKSIEKPDKSIAELQKEIKPHQIYVMKGLAWVINLFWAWFRLFVSPMGDNSLYKPIIGTITLLDVGAIVSELAIFFILTNLYRWLTWRK